jgi:zinc/manganese transport system substrate-binding protein
MKIRLLLTAASVLVLAACTTPSAADDRIQLVASTDVYGSIASVIGGDLVAVSSIISGPGQDPHSFEASAGDQLAVSRADIVIENGGGYDSFIETLLEGSGSAATVITATALAEGDAEHEDEGEHEAEAEGEAHAHEEHGHDHGVNEHVWYDLHVMGEVAHELAHVLGELDPDNAEAFHENFEAFAAEIAGLESQVSALKADADADTGVVVTELVPLFLLEDAGFVNRTPAEFTEAIEEGADVSPRSLQETLDLFATGDVGLLAYNGQTASNETERVRDAAETANVPVVTFTETLPDGEDYLTWMAANIAAIASAVGR